MTYVIDKDGNLLVSADLDAIANPSGEGVSVDADGTITAKLGDAAGAQKWSVTDSGDAEVASIDSDGDAAFHSLALTEPTLATILTLMRW